MSRGASRTRSPSMHSRPRTALRGGKRPSPVLAVGASAHPLAGAQRASLSASSLCSMISHSSFRCSYAAPRSSSVKPLFLFVSKWLPRRSPRCRPRRSLRVSRWSARSASLGEPAPPVSSRGPASRAVLSSPPERLPAAFESYRFTTPARYSARESGSSSATAASAAPRKGSAVNMPSTFENFVMVSPFVFEVVWCARERQVDLSPVGSCLVLESLSEQDRPTRLGNLSRALLFDARGHAIHADADLGAEDFVARGHAVAEPGTRLAARRLVAALAGAAVAVRRAESIAAVLLDAELPGGVGIESAIVGSALAPTDLHTGIELMREIELLSGCRPTQQQRNRGAHARGSHASIHLLLLVSPIVDPALPEHVAEDATRLLRGA